jgi:hypothetical protein
MKYEVGDLVFIKECKYKSRFRLTSDFRLRAPSLDIQRYPHLKNTYGIIIETINHQDIWRGNKSTQDDNIYLWYSQVDAKTYHFCENELTQYWVVK